MLRSRFLWRLYTGFGLLIVLLTVALAWLAASQMKAHAMAAISDDLRHDIILLTDDLDRRSHVQDADLQEQLVHLGRATGTRYTILAADGRVRADSHNDPMRMENHADRPEIIAARGTVGGPTRSTRSTRFSTTEQHWNLYVARAWVREGDVIGYVRAARSLAHIRADLRRLSWRVVGVSLVAALSALVLGWVLARRISAPVTALTATARAIADGDLERSIEVEARDEIGALAEAFSSMTDQLRARIAASVAAASRLQAILGSMVEGVIAVDDREHLLFRNQAAAVMLELPASEDARVSGRPLWEYCRYPALTRALSGVLRDGAAQVTSLRIHHRSRITELEIHADAIRDEVGSVIGAVAALHDVSDIKRLERVRQDFVANVSHELKTPLTAMILLIETLRDDPDMDPVVRKGFLDRAVVQGERLDHLIRDLLTLSRLESAPAAREWGEVDLEQVVRRCYQHCLPLAEARGQDCRLNITAEDTIVQGDGEAIGQAIDNLIQNAVRYTQEGGRIEVTLRDGNGGAVIGISDDGIGIPEIHRERVFERFYRVDKAHSRELGGTGLGLAIVKHVALLHGGAVEVDSEVGRGSTFRLSLPLAKPT